jgi:hypothetical protein
MHVFIRLEGRTRFSNAVNDVGQSLADVGRCLPMPDIALKSKCDTKYCVREEKALRAWSTHVPDNSSCTSLDRFLPTYPLATPSHFYHFRTLAVIFSLLVHNVCPMGRLASMGFACWLVLFAVLQQSVDAHGHRNKTASAEALAAKQQPHAMQNFLTAFGGEIQATASIERLDTMRSTSSHHA